MLILGIDPGISRTGYALIECVKDIPVLITSGVIKTKSSFIKNKIYYKVKLQHRMKNIFDSIFSIVNKYNPNYISIENPFFNGKNAKTLITQSQVIGGIIIACYHYSIHYYSPLEVKSSINLFNSKTSYMDTKKSIEESVKKVFNLNNKYFKYSDESDAIAIAYCHYTKISGVNKN